MRPGVRICTASLPARLALGLAAAAGPAMLAGCLAGCMAERHEPSFQSPTPRARAAAVARAATEQDPASIPDLIEALDDGDPVIRSWAIRGLEGMTGQTLGYDPFAPQGLRDEAVDRWVRWRREGGRTDIVEAEVEAEEAAGLPTDPPTDRQSPAPDSQR